MIDVAIPQFGDDDPSPARPSISVARKPSTFARIRQQDEEEYHLEHEKVEEDDKEDEGAKDEFFDTEDMIDGVRFIPSHR